MMNPMVSVIIPCYNSASYLSETIESVLVQDCPDIEIIVVDDGSTDNTADIVAHYPGIRYIRQRHAGLAFTRSNGLRHSAGEYIVCLDSDDRLIRGALALHLNSLMEQPDCAFSFGDVVFINAHGAELSDAECATLRSPKRLSPPYTGKDHYLPLLRSFYIPTPGMVMFRRTVLDAMSGFDTSMDPADDVDLIYRITRNHQACYVGAAVLEKRVHERSLMYHDLAKCIRAMMRLFRRQQRLVQYEPAHRAALQHNMRWFEDSWARSLIQQIMGNVRHGRNWQQTGDDLVTFLRYTPVWPARYIYRRCRRLLVERLSST
jgi:glycosyltransferase involved in cell wall biosynthesis